MDERRNHGCSPNCAFTFAGTGLKSWHGFACFRSTSPTEAVFDRTDGQRLQVDFGKDETTLIHLWQVIEKIP